MLIYINRQHKCMKRSEDVADGDNFDKSDENIIAVEQNKQWSSEVKR